MRGDAMGGNREINSLPLNEEGDKMAQRCEQGVRVDALLCKKGPGASRSRRFHERFQQFIENSDSLRLTLIGLSFAAQCKILLSYFGKEAA